MKKTVLYTILFFLATATILVHTTACEEDDAPVTLKLVPLGNGKYAIDQDGDAVIQFKGHSSNPEVKSVEYSVSAVAGSPSSSKAVAAGTVQVISNGTDCTVFFHANDPATFAGATITVAATKVIYRDGHVGLFLSQAASSTATVFIQPLPVNPGDPEDEGDDEDDDDEDDEEKTGLDLAASLDENTLFYDGVVLPAGDGDSGNYICWHPYYGGSEEISHYTIHTLRDGNGVGIVVTPSMFGTEYDMLNQVPLTKMGMLVEMYFVSLMDPTQPQSADNPAFVYGTLPDHTDFEIEEALARCDHNTSDDSITFIGYMRATDGSEFYCNLRVPRG